MVELGGEEDVAPVSPANETSVMLNCTIVFQQHERSEKHVRNDVSEYGVSAP